MEEAIREMFPGVEVLTMTEAAKFMRCDIRTLENTDSFPAVKLGRTYRVGVKAFAKWLSGGGNNGNS